MTPDLNSRPHLALGCRLNEKGQPSRVLHMPERALRLNGPSLEIIERHAIPAWNVVAHSDVAPDRKEDPGEKFDWQGLAENGVGLLPEMSAAPVETNEVWAMLAEIGYRTDLELAVVLRAFQRHWRQESFDGRLDAETLARLAGVRQRIRSLLDANRS